MHLEEELQACSCKIRMRLMESVFICYRYFLVSILKNIIFNLLFQQNVLGALARLVTPNTFYARTLCMIIAHTLFVPQIPLVTELCHEKLTFS